MLVKLIVGSDSLVKRGSFMREKASDPRYLGPPVMIAKFFAPSTWPTSLGIRRVEARNGSGCETGLAQKETTDFGDTERWV